MPMKLKKQRGVGLIEMMVSLVIGMIVIAGALTMATSTMGANANQMQMSRLNNELRMAMGRITQDMRRSGYNNWPISNPGNLSDKANLAGGVFSVNPQAGPVVVATSGYDTTASGGTTLAPASISITPGSESISVSYTLDPLVNPVPGTSYPSSQTFSYRLNNNSIETRTGTGTWSAVLDPSVIQIDSFTIIDRSQVIPTTLTGASQTITLPIFSISITGHLLKDATVSRTIQETVRLRNVILS